MLEKMDYKNIKKYKLYVTIDLNTNSRIFFDKDKLYKVPHFPKENLESVLKHVDKSNLTGLIVYFAFTRKDNDNIIYKDSVFDISENAFICTDCARQNSAGIARSGQFFISGDSLDYLNAIFEKSPKEVRAIKCTAKTVNELKQLGFYLIETAIGQKLKTLDTGLGIL